MGLCGGTASRQVTGMFAERYLIVVFEGLNIRAFRIPKNRSLAPAVVEMDPPPGNAAPVRPVDCEGEEARS